MKHFIKTIIRVSGLDVPGAYLIDVIRIIQTDIDARHMRICMCCC